MDDLSTARIPPSSIDAEQSVIGGLLLRPDAWWKVADVITAEDFYRHDHQLIFRAIAELAKDGKPFDAVTLGEWLESRSLDQRIGGSGYLIELASSTPSAANIRAYADIVREKAALRRLIEVSTNLVDAAYRPDGRSAIDLVGDAQSRIGHLLDSEPCELEPMGPILRRCYDGLQRRHSAGERITGLSTGLQDLDDILSGLNGGQLIILAARPKMGKTTLAQNIAEHCALVVKKPVAIFSFEMQPEELGDRMVSSLTSIPGDRIRCGQLEDIDWPAVTQANKELNEAPIFISRPRNARVEHVIAQVRRQHAKAPLGLVVIDYLQLMQVSGDNRAQAYGDVTRALKLMAGELNIPVLLLSQLNRNLENRNDKRPVPADLRDSGSIEQDADAVIFIYRDEIYDKQSRYRGTAEIIVALQRQGAAGEMRALYQPALFKFSNLPLDWMPEPMPDRDAAPARRGFRKVKSTGNAAAASADAFN